jgi:hypothetical protein
MHNGEICNLYSLPIIINMIKSRKMSWAGYVTNLGEKINAYNILVTKPESKRPLGRPRHSLENIKMYFKQIRFEDVDWFHQFRCKFQRRILVDLVRTFKFHKRQGIS